ncbi:lantibiotic dehydratase [Sphaerisporangium rufum]|uniref:Lantibiotic dehydratase n=1 Tax=Sphaerisporangium rufum TaxID=1381558 RepID=A0A919R5R0_9ACTN|nr:lantibiotic dehydratase [Sphaerisporangium rufum]GII79999.1 lantibiotic dehydratase [Sphaerisporangium rufum]
MEQFGAAGHALLRIATLPAGRVAATRDDGGDPAAHLRALTADPMVREAITVSSPALAHVLDAVHDGRPVEERRLRRAVRSTTRYVLRMATRPTPFGLMAGVAAAGFDDAAKIRLGDRPAKGVRPDAGWLLAVVRDLEGDPAVLRTLRVVRNDLCAVRGDRLVLAHLPRNVDSSAARELSIRMTPLVGVALAGADRPVRFADLAASLAEAFPGAAAAKIENVLAQLVERSVLLTELVPPDDAADPLAHVIGLLPPDAAAGLREVAAAVDAYAAAPAGGGLPAWRELTAATSRLRAEHRSPHVDLRCDADVRLPDAVAAEFAALGALLARLTPPGTGTAALRAYHDEFLERYGTARLVPVRELLDPELGLGLPAGYQGSERPEVDDEPDRFRDRVLGELVQGALLDGAREIELDDTAVDRLAHRDDGRLPPVVEIGAHLIAASTEALDAGDFRLVLANMPMPRRAGALSGRVAYLLDDLRDQAAALWREAAAAVPAQVTFETNWSRNANVARAPIVAAHRLPVGGFADRGDPAVLSLDDLTIGSTGDRMFVYAPRIGAEVAPAVLHMLVLRYNSPAPARFLCEVASAARRAIHPWDWGSVAATLPYLPRVRRGRLVLSPASWRIAAELNDLELPQDTWNRLFDRWRERWGVPREAYLTSGDNRVGLDLDAPVHRELLRHELARRPGSLLVEPPGGAGFGTGWLDGRAGELVVTLRSAQPPAPAVRGPVRLPVRTRARAVRHHPGGEWLFAKLYAAAGRQTELLRDRLPVLTDALPECVDRWFFIRYFDPAPHLRLRFHGDPARLAAEVLPLVHDWSADLCRAGLARAMLLDAYEPEVDRYGGPAALEAAERVFHADSVAVLAQLRLRLDLPTGLLAAANHVDLVRAFDPEHGDDWTAARGSAEHHAAFQAIRRTAIGFIGGADLDPRVAEIWRARRPAVARYGELVRALSRGASPAALLHMHHNRLVGVSESSEGASYAIARGAVRALRDRARHGR